MITPQQEQDAKFYTEIAVILRLHAEDVGYQADDGEFFHVWPDGRVNHTIVRNHLVVFACWEDVTQLPEAEKRQLAERYLLSAEANDYD